MYPDHIIINIRLGFISKDILEKFLSKCWKNLLFFSGVLQSSRFSSLHNSSRSEVDIKFVISILVLKLLERRSIEPNQRNYLNYLPHNHDTSQLITLHVDANEQSWPWEVDVWRLLRVPTMTGIRYETKRRNNSSWPLSFYCLHSVALRTAWPHLPLQYFIFQFSRTNTEPPFRSLPKIIKSHASGKKIHVKQPAIYIIFWVHLKYPFSHITRSSMFLSQWICLTLFIFLCKSVKTEKEKRIYNLHPSGL